MVPNQMRYQTALRSEADNVPDDKAFAAITGESQAEERATQGERLAMRRLDHRNITGEGSRSVRVLVCGGRDFADETAAWNALSAVFDEIGEPEIIIHGGAPGADAIAADYAHRTKVRCHAFPANWKKYGKRAGPMRNQRMIDEGRPTLVLAFPGGRGTADMIRRAREAGIEVREVGGRPRHLREGVGR